MKKLILITIFTIAVLCTNAIAEDKADQLVSQEAVAKVEGMVCDFCARGIEKLFLKREEVQTVEISLEKGEVRLQFKPNKQLTDSEIKQIIESNGISTVSVSRVDK